MLDIAATQTLGGEALYDQINLLEPLPSDMRADLILCLWEVTNSVGKDATRLVTNLAAALSEGGYLVYDMITMKAATRLKQEEEHLLATRLELKRSPDTQRVWYQRDDKSIGYLRMFTTAELNALLSAPKLQTCAAWGYRHRELVPYKLNLSDNKVSEEEAADYSGILVVQQQ